MTKKKQVTRTPQDNDNTLPTQEQFAKLHSLLKISEALANRVLSKLAITKKRG